MATDAELGWIAGFFDGEGHVSYRRSRPTKRGKIRPILEAVVPQKDDNVEVLEYFQSIVGFGTMYGPYFTTTNGTVTRRFDLKYRTTPKKGINEVERLFTIIKPYLKSRKTDDFTRAIMSYYMHDSKMTSDDVAKMVKVLIRCPKCKQKWNGMVCMSCGYM